MTTPISGSEFVTDDFAQGVQLQLPRGPAVILSAHTYDCSHFGFRSGALTSPTDLDILVAAAPDNSAGARDIEDFFANWRERTARPAKVLFGPGIWKFDGLMMKENVDRFYQRSGLILEGAGKGASILAASVSSKAQFFGLDGQTNWTHTPTLRRLMLYGAGNSNPYQVGAFLNPEPVPDLGGPGVAFGGVTSAHWEDVEIRKFAREQLWLRGGSADYSVPIQYGVWDRIMLIALNAEYSALKMTGQVGPPWDFGHIETGGVGDLGGTTAPVVYLGLDQRTGIPIVDVTVDRVLFAEPHRFKTGDRVAFDKSGGGTWGGLTIGNPYYASVIDAFRLKLGTSVADVVTSSPSYVTLSAAAGTGVTGRSDQVFGTHIPPVQVNFKTFNCNTGKVGIHVNGGTQVNMESTHSEDLTEFANTQNGGNLSISSGLLLKMTRETGDVVFRTLDEYSRITVGDGVALDGVAPGGKIAESVNSSHGVVLPKSGFSGQYVPTIGPALSNRLPKNWFQIGNAALIDLVQRIGGDYIFNTGATVYQNVKWQADSGSRAFFQVWDGGGGASSFAEIGTGGNISLSACAVNDGTVRLPLGATFELICTAINSGVRMNNVSMPVHSGPAWVLGTGKIAAGASVSTTVTCPGARVGDLRPIVSVSAALDASLRMDGEISASDTARITIWNPSASPVSLPGTVTPYARQIR